MTVVKCQLILKCDICYKQGHYNETFPNGIQLGQLNLAEGTHLCYGCRETFDTFVTQQRAKHRKPKNQDNTNG